MNLKGSSKRDSLQKCGAATTALLALPFPGGSFLHGASVEPYMGMMSRPFCYPEKEASAYTLLDPIQAVGKMCVCSGMCVRMYVCGGMLCVLICVWWCVCVCVYACVPICVGGMCVVYVVICVVVYGWCVCDACVLCV